MIEMVSSNRQISASTVAGKYLVMSLPLSDYRSIFPASPIFVQDAADNKAKMYAWPIKASFSDDGICRNVRTIRADDGPLIKRLEPFDGFVCDSEADVVALINLRNDIEKTISVKAGYVNDAVIALELEALYSDVIEASKSRPVSPRMAEEVAVRAFA